MQDTSQINLPPKPVAIVNVPFISLEYARAHTYISQVGIATQFPSGCHSDRNLNHDDFFRFLLEKHDAYEKIPATRFNIEA